jgi:hypothetical protein
MKKDGRFPFNFCLESTITFFININIHRYADHKYKDACVDVCVRVQLICEIASRSETIAGLAYV